MSDTPLLNTDAPSRDGAEAAAIGASSGLAPEHVLVAVLVAAAGAIHLVMVPSHASEWMAEGVAFAVAGWLQIGVAVLLVTRPSRPALRIGAAISVVFIAAWAVSRIWGPPFGPESGVPHDVSFIDLTCVGFEAAFAVGAVILSLTRTSRSARSSSNKLAAVWSPLALGVVVLSIVAITSPSAAGHGHSETGGHSHGVEEAADDGHSHEHTDDVAAADGHAHDDAAGMVMNADGSMTTEAVPADEEADGHSHGGAPVDFANFDDKGLAELSNGEMAHEYGPDESLDAQTRAALVHQLALTRLIIDRFPTLKDAKAAGSEAAGAFGPGMGVHMGMPHTGMPVPPPRDPTVPYIPGTLTDEELMHPANLLYGGSSDDSKIVGLMYYALTPDEPAGFAGPNDHWHTHGSLCIKMGGAGGRIEVLDPSEKTKESCEGVGGFYVEKTNWMVHVWTVPGYESNRGVFSDINPAVACPDGTYHRVTEEQTKTYKVNHCLSNPE